MTDWISKDNDDYISKAIKYSSDLDFLKPDINPHFHHTTTLYTINNISTDIYVNDFTSFDEYIQ